MGGQMLRAVTESGEEIIAESWLERKAHHCPQCGSVVILKAGRYKCAHFAHRRSEGCGFGEGESKEHLAIKKAVRDDLISRGWQNVTVEKRIGRHITDIYAELKGKSYCFEVQCSNIDPEEIVDRIRCYDEIGAVTIWILYSKMADTWEEGDEVRIKKWWMMLQSQQFGTNCFVGPSCEVRIIRLEKAYSWVESSEYGGGYYKTLKQTKTISLPPNKIGFEDLKICQSKQGYRVWSIPFPWLWWAIKKKGNNSDSHFDP